MMKTILLLPLCLFLCLPAGFAQCSGAGMEKLLFFLDDSTTAAAPKHLALGDSYTIGQGVTLEESFPYITSRILEEQGSKSVDLKYIATTGWTTRSLLSAIQKDTTNTYDVVTLLIGVNDQFYGVDTAVYRLRFKQLLDKANELAAFRPSRVFVLSIPDYSETPFVAPHDKERVRREIGWFNDINKQVTLRSGITYINITSLSREAANDSSLLAADQLHYSGKEHQKWAQLLAPLVKAALQ
ncbi:MAG TPA: GDSL-type esterase/lipase family protein [Flavisolibacter sp.]|nr:GDSL-type esterase/lipase family protein [Flavisolibacter sp.]